MGLSNALPRRAISLAGQKFGRLTAIEPVRLESGRLAWACRCACGEEARASAGELRAGTRVSCGCLKPVGKPAHGESRTPLHVMWCRMGSSGLSVAPEWRDFAAFRAWALAQGYDRSQQLRRRQRKQGFSPDNCRLVAVKDAAGNRLPFAHGLGGYRNHGCRCDTCRAAQRTQVAAYRARRSSLGADGGTRTRTP